MVVSLSPDAIEKVRPGWKRKSDSVKLLVPSFEKQKNEGIFCNMFSYLMAKLSGDHMSSAKEGWGCLTRSCHVLELVWGHMLSFSSVAVACPFPNIFIVIFGLSRIELIKNLYLDMIGKCKLGKNRGRRRGEYRLMCN